MEAPQPTQADFNKTIAIVLLAEYLAVSLAHAASLALADAPHAVAMTARVAALWLFAGTLAINLVTMAGAYAMRRSENAPFARTSLAMTSGLAAIMVASWM